MSKVKFTYDYDGQVARLTLAAPKANVLDLAMMEDLGNALADLAQCRRVKAVVLGAEGPHFSFGASVQEHLPEQVGALLPRLGRLLRQLLDVPAPTIAAVRGQCLGGAFELVLACDLIVAEETAELGCPEIKLAVFPPAAAALLPLRVGASRAAELVLTGGVWRGSAALAAGLVARLATAGELDSVVDGWIRTDFLPRSAAALGHAARAVRLALRRALEHDLPTLERAYLEELMAEPDAVEGLRAFLEKRPPRWGQSGAVA
jgi:cyclohexa-1,5-dienecarbonyl-CoA hydratase